MSNTIDHDFICLSSALSVSDKITIYLQGPRSPAPRKKNKNTSFKIFKTSILDLTNPPEMVSWAFSGDGKDDWSPLVEEYMLPDHVKEQWAETFLLGMNNWKRPVPQVNLFSYHSSSQRPYFWLSVRLSRLSIKHFYNLSVYDWLTANKCAFCSWQWARAIRQQIGRIGRVVISFPTPVNSLLINPEVWTYVVQCQFSWGCLYSIRMCKLNSKVCTMSVSVEICYPWILSSP